MTVLSAISGFIADIMPVWDQISFLAGPLFIFFALRIFPFRYPRRRQGLILAAAAVLNAAFIVLFEAFVNLFFQRFVPFSYLRISVISFVIIVCGALLLYRGNKLLIALSVLLLYNFFSAIRFVFVGLFSFLLPDSALHMSIALAILPTGAILAVFAFFSPRIQKAAVSGLNARESALWFGVALASMVLMCFQSDFQLAWWQTMLNGLNLIMTTSAIYALIFLYSKQKFIVIEQQKILSNMEKYEGYLEQMKELDAHISTQRHEVKNHIFYIDQLLAQGELDKLRAYVDQLKSDRLASPSVVSCGNSIIDSIVNAKCAYAQSLGVQTEAEIRLPDIVRIDDLSLCSVLGNILTNAVEGSENVENARIRLDIHPFKDYLVITVSNRVASNVIKENPHLLSTKKDAANHGIGLKVVEQVAQWYDGDLRLEMGDKHTFCASVMLKNRPYLHAGKH